MATYAIGDVHGCFEALQRLVAHCGFDGAHDTLWLTGDLINRGPQSLETLRWVKSLKQRAVVILGNHDLHLLAIYYGDKRIKKKDTLAPVLSAPDAGLLLSWLRQQPLLHYDQTLNACMVHAGIPHIWTLKQARALAHEAETIIRSEQCSDFFCHMYGNTPEVWDDQLTGHDRTRAIVNYFTRMRFISQNGVLDFKSKDVPGHAPHGFLPWFKHPSACNTRIIFGHWAALQGRTDNENMIGLDTGCAWGGSLSAIRLEDGKRFNVPANP